MASLADKKKALDWSNRNTQGLQGILDVNQFLPVTGDVQSGIMAGQDLQKGNYGSAALNSLGLLPFIPALGGVIAKNIPSKTTFESAQETAQRNASLPVSEGGLGLPPNNTAMDRASAMGFDTDNVMYHGSGKKINEFKDWQSRKKRSSDGIFFTDSKDLAKEYGRVANEAYLKKGNNYLYDAQGNSFSDIDTQNALLRRLNAMRGESSVTMNNFVDAPNPFQNSSTLPSTITAVNQPNQIRSPNAAFDPFRRNEADILAGAVAAPVGLLAIDKEKTKKKRSNK